MVTFLALCRVSQSAITNMSLEEFQKNSRVNRKSDKQRVKVRYFEDLDLYDRRKGSNQNKQGKLTNKEIEDAFEDFE